MARQHRYGSACWSVWWQMHRALRDANIKAARALSGARRAAGRHGKPRGLISDRAAAAEARKSSAEISAHERHEPGAGVSLDPRAP